MKIKKLLSLLVALALVCSFMTMTTVQAAEDEFAILRTLGINTDFSDDTTPITRYQLAEIAMELTGLSPEEDGQPTYPDIPVKHKYFPMINAVTVNGLMGALADGSFSPDAPASAMDGGRVLLSELGYTAFAVQAGWTDAQYNSKVQSLGLMSGVDASEGLTARGIGKMMVNMLTKKVMEIVAVDAEGVKFRESNLTYIESKYGYVIKTGVLQANGYASASGCATVTTKQAVIDGVLYKTDGRDFTNYVGYNVRFILTSEYEDGRIIHMEKYRGSDELVIDADDILSYSSNTYTYVDETGSSETVSFSSAARIVLNGENVNPVNDSYFTPDVGKVTLVDTDADYTYDLVNITSKVYIKISGTTANAVSDGLTGSSIDLRDKETYIYKNGMATDHMSLSQDGYAEFSTGAIKYTTVQGNVIMQPDVVNSEVLVINEIDTTRVTGLISKKRVDAIGIEGTVYEMNDYYYDLVKSGYVDPLVLGSTATLVLNNKNQIIDVVDVVSEYANSEVPKKYGYMTGIGKARGETEQAVVKIIDLETMTVVTYETDKECRYNGKKFEYSKHVPYNSSNTTNTCFYLPDGEFKHQLIRYALNEEGKISEIYLAVDRAHKYVTKHILPASYKDIVPETTVDYYLGTSPAFVSNSDYDTYYNGYDNNNFTLDGNGYLSARSSIDGLYQITGATIQLRIPVDKGDYSTFANVQDPKYWQVEISSPKSVSADTLLNQSMTEQSKWSYLALYDCSEKFVPAVAIKYVKLTPVTGNEAVAGTEFSENRYSESRRYYYVTDVNVVFDEATFGEKVEVTGVAGVNGGTLTTKKFIPAKEILESTVKYTRILTGYNYLEHLKTPDNYQQKSSKNWNEIKVGDIIEVLLNTAGEVGGFRIVVDGDIIKDYDNLVPGFVSGERIDDEMGYHRVNLGYCVKSFGADGAIINILGPNGGVDGLKKVTSLNYTPGGNNSIKGAAMIIHTKSKTVEAATLEDIKVGDWVMYRRNTGTVVEVFIIRP